MNETEAATEAAELVTLFELLAEPGLIDGQTVDAVAHRLGDEVVEDDLGRRCVTRDTARRLVAERREREARHAEEARRRREGRKSRPVPAGVPAQEDMTPLESMAAAGGVVLPSEEFGREPPNSSMRSSPRAGVPPLRRSGPSPR